MPYILFLDDSKERKEFWKSIYPGTWFVSTAEDAIREISMGGHWDYIFLDHDLGEGNQTGMKVVEFLENSGGLSCHPLIVIHSWNTPAAIEMNDRINKIYGLSSIRIPFSFNVRLNND